MDECKISTLIETKVKEVFQADEEVVALRTGNKNVILGKIDLYFSKEQICLIFFKNDDRRKILEMTLMIKPFYKDCLFILFPVEEIQPHIMNVTETISHYYGIKIINNLQLLEQEIQHWESRDRPLE
jgi:hypothetical protein